MQSCIYEGTITHTRHRSPSGTFRYPLFMMYLDLDELPALFDGHALWSARGPNVAWFRREDHHGDPRVPLDETIRDLAGRALGTRPSGPVRLLTHLRYLGCCFNPVSFYYCMAPDGARIDSVVAEVSNTPWNEQHMYVIPGGRSPVVRHVTPKAFHVSPFLDMALEYEWVFHEPGPSLSVGVGVRRDSERVLDATLALRRRPIDRAELRRLLFVKPAMTLQVLFGIYFEAFALWRRGATFFAHPQT